MMDLVVIAHIDNNNNDDDSKNDADDSYADSRGEDCWLKQTGMLG